mmetsp:Transcript_57157/g.68350  ORF Transcript_57157/g.68350 Transcript_57157/m.68350 type:complete len:163 (+) Transcript_57157:1614-2102(+)
MLRSDACNIGQCNRIPVTGPTVSMMYGTVYTLLASVERSPAFRERRLRYHIFVGNGTLRPVSESFNNFEPQTAPGDVSSGAINGKQTHIDRQNQRRRNIGIRDGGDVMIISVTVSRDEQCANRQRRAEQRPSHSCVPTEPFHSFRPCVVVVGTPSVRYVTRN